MTRKLWAAALGIAAFSLTASPLVRAAESPDITIGITISTSGPSAAGDAGGSVAGTHFWAWSGEGRAQHPDHHFQPGDTSYLGDPPHEPQGWYGVFDVDASTQAVIRDHAAAVKALPAV